MLLELAHSILQTQCFSSHLSRNGIKATKLKQTNKSHFTFIMSFYNGHIYLITTNKKIMQKYLPGIIVSSSTYLEFYGSFFLSQKNFFQNNLAKSISKCCCAFCLPLIIYFYVFAEVFCSEPTELIHFFLFSIFYLIVISDLKAQNKTQFL